jgi:hypothetical protein
MKNSSAIQTSPLNARKQATRDNFFKAWGNINADIQIDLSPASVSNSVTLESATDDQKSDALQCALAIESVSSL